MSEIKWTPGPWSMIPTKGAFRVCAEDLTTLARVYLLTSQLPLRGQRNAVLMAAAPALFHALVGLLESLEDAARNNPEAWLEFINEIAIDLPEAMATASAAVQKAIGETKGRPALQPSGEKSQ